MKNSPASSVRPSTHSSSLPILLGVGSFILALGMLVARVVYPELIWLTIVLGVALLATLGMWLSQNRKALRSRTAAYGLNSAITVLLVLGIIGTLNFLVARYPKKVDLTRNKANTLSDQTAKVVKGLNQPLKAVYYSKIMEKEQIRPLLENYHIQNQKFEVEYVDPDKETARVKQQGIKRYKTLQLIYGPKESKVEDPTEEKITNALIKITQEKNQVICATTGHGERNFQGQDAEGYDVIRKALIDQTYEYRDLNLLEKQKIPQECSALIIAGPTKSFFEAELKILKEWLSNGGRAVFALDLNVKGTDYSPELLPILESWSVKADRALIVDPVSQQMDGDASVPRIMTFNKEQPITKEATTCHFPLSRPLEPIAGSQPGLNVQWLAKTTPIAWGITDLKSLGAGRLSKGANDIAGPLTVAISVDGKQKDSKASRNTRIVVFGSSAFATNNYTRFGGDQDLFLNAVSWTVEDESLISIRPKEDQGSKVDLSQKQGAFIFILSVIIMPISIFVAGIVIWVLRRRL